MAVDAMNSTTPARRASPRHQQTDPPDAAIGTRRTQLLGWGLLALSIALAVNSVLGPLAADVIDYPVSSTMRNQTIGLDAASLFVVAPLTASVAVLALRGHAAAPVLALGPTGYVAYMFVQYIAGPDHLSYPPVLTLQLALFTGGWLLAGLAWRVDRARPDAARPDLAPWHRLVALGLGGFVLLRYLPGLLGSATDESLPAELATDPAMYWLILLLDLGVYLPATVAAAVGLGRTRSWAAALHRGLVGWFLLTTVAVTAMSVTMVLNDDPNASTGQLGLFIAVGIGVAGYATTLFRPILRNPESPSAPSARSAWR